MGIDETHKKNQEPVQSNRNIRIYRGITTFLYMIVEEDALYINVNRRFVVGIDETHKKTRNQCGPTLQLEYTGELPLFYIRHFTRLVKSQRKDTTQPLHMKVNMRFVVGIDETHKKNQDPVRSNIAIRIYRGITTFLYKAFYQTC